VQCLESRVLLAAAPAIEAGNLTLSGNATVVTVPAEVDPDRTAIQLTDNVTDQLGGAFLSARQNVNRDFSTEFTFQIPQSTGADGFAFVIQGNSPTTLGAAGGGLGYFGMPKSLAVKFDTFPRVNQTGVYVNGAMNDNGPDIGLELANGHVYKATIAYDADAEDDHDALTLRIDDVTDSTAPAFLETFTSDQNGNAFDIDQIVGGDTAFIGFTGSTGGLGQQQLILDWDLWNLVVEQPTQVTQVFLNGPGLTGGTPTVNQQAFRSLAGIDPTYGYPVPGGADQLKPISWINGVNEVAVRFGGFAPPALDANSLRVRGVNMESYPVIAFRYDPATRTGVWTLPAAVTNDSLRLLIDDAGQWLDGEWHNGADAYPSGNGQTGGGFDFQANVLAGATQSGQVSALDLSFIRQRLNKAATNPGSTGATYSPFADLNADGLINALDLAAAKQRLNRRLPGEP
jgi:hypothetical protein